MPYITNETKEKLEKKFNDLKIKTDKEIHRNGDPSALKNFLTTYVPNEIIYISKNLLDNALDNFIDKNSNLFENVTEMMNFKKTIFDKVSGNISMDPIQYSFDPRLKEGLIAGGITFFLGTTVNLIIPKGLLISFLFEIAVGATSYFAGKHFYQQATPKTLNLIKEETYEFISKMELIVIKWIEDSLHFAEKELKK